MTALGKTKLGVWLRKAKPEYFYKAEELRDTVTGWLGYIVQTFPHYTKHTVDHSDNIVQQMSHLLFPDKGNKPVVAFSAIEAYVLIAAAYLHDAGMVVPDAEKVSILESDDWKRWIATGASERWEKVQSIRDAAAPTDKSVRDFLADLYTRHLIAEFIRRVHHKRAARVVAEHPVTFEHFSLNDPLVARTIADVCLGHGLSHNELKDPYRYPELRQLAGENANVRWMAILLRLGDLLDMRADRACPLLLNAAAPLPPESIVHWMQYQKLTHFLVAPKRIEIRAECDTRDEYQVLRDWCQWIEDEAKNASVVMAHAARHADWPPPEATIDIAKSPAAKFLIEDWKFELDRDAVFDRLINDVYDEPITFIRELIQNALDATRVQMYLDLDAAGIPRPEYPTQIDVGRREKYPVEITLETRTIRNDHTGAEEERQVFTITDRGVGMDRDIISRYLLQIGRSYYVSDEFQRAFRFVPTSRFGIGFLSVFAVADEVTVETYKPTSPAHDGPIRLTLRGVRNYVLPQEGSRRQRGTRIEVLLKKPIAVAEARKAIEDWCRRVEVPIRLVTSEGTTVIRSEKASDFESHVPDVDTPGAEWHIRAHPFQTGGVQGEIYIESRSCNGVEEIGHDRNVYNHEHPFHQLPQIDDPVTCLHGIDMGSPDTWVYWSFRIDIRRPNSTTLSRVSQQTPTEPLLEEVRCALESVIQTHIEQCPSASGPDGWRYLQRLAAAFNELPAFWDQIPMVPATTPVGARLLTIANIAMEPEILTTQVSAMRHGQHESDFSDAPSLALSEPTVVDRVLDGRRAVAACVDGTAVLVKWGPVGQGKADIVFKAYGRSATVDLLPIIPIHIAAIIPTANKYVVNRDHPLASWVLAAQPAMESGVFAPSKVLNAYTAMYYAAWGDLQPNLEPWNHPSIPQDLRLPRLVPIMPGVLGTPDPDDAPTP